MALIDYRDAADAAVRELTGHEPRTMGCGSQPWTGLASTGRVALIDYRDAADAAVRELTGHEPRTIEQFFHQNRELFR